MPTKDLRFALFIALAVLVLFVPGLGNVHLFDWDEINFAEIAREMIVLDNYSRVHINFEPFWEKPPLFMWMQVVCMKLFGVGEFAARLPNAICGFFSLLVLYRIGKQEEDRTFGIIWVLCYLASILPHLYFRSGIIDPWLNLFIFLGLHYFITAIRELESASGNGHRKALLGGVFIGLAMLSKGQVALIILGLSVGVHFLIGARSGISNAVQGLKQILPLALLLLGSSILITSLWFGYEIIVNGPWMVEEFIRYQYRLFSTPDAGHGGFPGYHFVVLLVGCFPASVFAIQEMLRKSEGNPKRSAYRKWMLVLFWVVLILFTIVKSKIVHYSSMCYFPLTYLAALSVTRIWKERSQFGWTRFLLGGIGSTIALVVIALPWMAMDIEVFRLLFEKDPFAAANLNANVKWTGWESAPGVLLFVGLLSAHFLHGAKRIRTSLITVALVCTLFIPLTLYFFINRIEGYSQNAAVEFYESKQGEDCYVITEGFKSYAHLFYSRSQPKEKPMSRDQLLNGQADKPVYVVTKVNYQGSMNGFEMLERKNGFVFWRKRSEIQP